MTTLYLIYWSTCGVASRSIRPIGNGYWWDGEETRYMSASLACRALGAIHPSDWSA